MSAKKPVRRNDLCIFLNSKNSVEWGGVSDPQLSPDEAVAIGINRAAEALSEIAGALNGVASALDRLADAK